MQDELGNAFGQLLSDICKPDAVRAIDAGQSSDALWSELVNSGFLDALVPESQGGAGLGLSDVLSLVQLCGYHAVPLPFAETMAARAVLASEGREWPATPLLLDTVDSKLTFDERITLRAAVCAGQIAGAAERVLELTLAHAGARIQFGKPIGSFQAVQHQLSVMAEQVCAARIASQLCFASKTHMPDRTLTGMAMVVAGEAAASIAPVSHAVHGAIGICEETDLQLYTRRLLTWSTQAGSPAYWSRQVGQHWWTAGDNTSGVDFALDSLQRAV